MWIFTELADYIDRIRRERVQRVLDADMGDMVAGLRADPDPGARFLGAPVAVVGRALHAGVLEVGSDFMGTFVDVLRLGDGVGREGGLRGWGHDGLRVVMLIGPALKVLGFARMTLAAVAEVDMMTSLNNCTWVAAARALRLTGVRHFATLARLSEAAGLPNVSAQGGAFASEMAGPLEKLGAEFTVVPAPASIEELTTMTTRAYSRTRGGVTLFSVQWSHPSAGTVGHTMIAFLRAEGTLAILDRTGRVVSQLSDLEGTYTGISGATFYGNAVTVANSWVRLGDAGVSTLANLLLLEIQSVPLASSGGRAAVAPHSGDDGSPPFNSLCTASGAPCIYRVRAGDTLQSISQAAYGNPDFAEDLYEANRDRVGASRGDLRAGLVLDIP